MPASISARIDTLTSDPQTNPDLVRPSDIRGLLHAHSRYADGAHSMRRLVETARELGLDYLGISDHLRSTRHPEGLDLPDETAQHAEIAELRREFPDFERTQMVAHPR